MADVHDKIKFLKVVRLNPEVFLPIVDHAWKVFPDRDTGKEWYDDPEVNIGWDAGLVDGNRPYFAECWASCGITMLTYFISAKGMEEAKTEDLVRLLEGGHLVTFLDREHPRVSVMKFEDDSENVFFSINITVGYEDETYIKGGRIFPYGPLNEYNSRKLKEAEENGQ